MPARLDTRTRATLTLQRRVGHLLAVVWVPLAAFLMRFVMGYRIRNAAELRQRYRRMVRNSDAPLLICPNHLTLIDSALVAWALGGSWWYLAHYSGLPWNVPEETNFASTWISRVVTWVTKCIPVRRGGDREQVAAVRDRLCHLLERGETVLVFPEGGRSRSGRVEPGSASYGVGRILNEVPECRVLCVYLRGEAQESWSSLPVRGDTFRVDISRPDLGSPHSGLRRARDLSRQIVRELARLERRHLAHRQ